MRSPTRNTFMSSSNLMSCWHEPIGTSNSSCRRRAVVDRNILPANRQYLPAVLLHLSSALDNAKPMHRIPRPFDIFHLHYRSCPLLELDNDLLVAAMLSLLRSREHFLPEVRSLISFKR